MKICTWYYEFPSCLFSWINNAYHQIVTSSRSNLNPVLNGIKKNLYAYWYYFQYIPLWTQTWKINYEIIFAVVICLYHRSRYTLPYSLTPVAPGHLIKSVEPDGFHLHPSFFCVSKIIGNLSQSAMQSDSASVMRTWMSLGWFIIKMHLVGTSLPIIQILSTEEIVIWNIDTNIFVVTTHPLIPIIEILSIG